MSYNIKNFAGTVTYTVNDSTANTNAVSLTLLGKSLPNYGTYFNQNFVWLTENFSSDSANPPPYAVQGQLWWDSTFKFLNVYDGSKWNTVYGNLSSLSVNGSILSSALNTTTANITNLNGTTGIFSGNINVNGGDIFTTSTYGNLYNANATTVNIGGAATTVSIGAMTGRTTINNDAAADNFYATGGGQVFGYHTGAIGANTPNSVVATSVTTSSGGQHIGYLTGALGANTPNSVIATSVTTSSGGQLIGYHTGAIGANTANSGAFTTISASSNISAYSSLNVVSNVGAGNFVANTATYSPQYYWANGVALSATITGLYSNSNVAAYLPTNTANIGSRNIFLTNGNLSANIGNINTMFSYSFANNFYGTSFYGVSTTAQYADLAEKYLTDTEYEIGTVVMVGGSAEVTQHNGSSVRAIGVVSAHPAYKMNDGLEGGTYIALKGRVPVKVLGPVKKGDSLAGTAHGIAYSQSETIATTFAIALENYTNTDIGLIEAVIL